MFDAFFIMRPIGGETSAQFTLRVENKKIQYSVKYFYYYHTFVQLLDESEKYRIDILRKLSITANNNTNYAVVM